MHYEYGMKNLLALKRCIGCYRFYIKTSVFLLVLVGADDKVFRTLIQALKQGFLTKLFGTTGTPVEAQSAKRVGRNVFVPE